MAITAGVQLPTNTFYYDEESTEVKHIIADAALSPGHYVMYTSGTQDLCEKATAGTSKLGVAMDNKQVVAGVAKDYDDAYAANDLVPVAIKGKVVAISDGTTTAGADQIVSGTAGQLTDGTTAGQVVGMALTTESPAGVAGKFVLLLH